MSQILSFGSTQNYSAIAEQPNLGASITLLQIRAQVDPAQVSGVLYLQMWEWGVPGQTGASPSIVKPFDAAGYLELDFGFAGRTGAINPVGMQLFLSSTPFIYTAVTVGGAPLKALWDVIHLG